MADSRKRIPLRDRLRDEDEDDDDLVGPRTGGTRAEREREPAPPRPRRPAPRRQPARSSRDGLRSLVREIPSFARLLWGLARDPRVSKADKAIVAGALVYTVLPADLIPDWVPGLGEVDDLVLVALALSRLLNNAGEDVLLDHWDGDDATLEAALDALERMSDLLPSPIRGLMGGRHR